jgi:hypothetical protein
MQRFITSSPIPNGLRAASDPLADFCAERHAPVSPVAAPSTPRPRDTRAISGGAVACPPPGSASHTPRVVWAFAMGLVCGALLGAMGLYQLAASQVPLPAPVAQAARAVVAYGSSLSGMFHR